MASTAAAPISNQDETLIMIPPPLSCVALASRARWHARATLARLRLHTKTQPTKKLSRFLDAASVDQNAQLDLGIGGYGFRLITLKDPGHCHQGIKDKTSVIVDAESRGSPSVRARDGT
jgi:hypothetical protein